MGRVNYSIPEDFNVDYMIDVSLNGKKDSDSHLAAIFGIAISIKAKTILELGVRSGKTTIPLLLAAEKTGGKLHSVDVVQADVTPPERLRSHWEFTASDAIKYLQKWDKSKKIDLVYVDDLHTYPHVAQELKLLKDLVTPSSVILLHDLMYGNWEPRYHTDMTLRKGQWAHGGPYRAVAELDPQHWEFSTIPSCNGLTILRNKGCIEKRGK